VKQADLPVEEPMKYDQLINLKTPKALRLTYSPLAREASRPADSVKSSLWDPT